MPQVPYFTTEATESPSTEPTRTKSPGLGGVKPFT